MWPALMLKRLADSMFQSCEVHEYCLNQSITLLSDGGRPQFAGMLKPYVSFMHQGSNWTDQGLRNLSHFYHPLEKKGLPGVHHAADELQSALEQMEKARKLQNPPRYFFCLGIALHLIQDLCVPHHVFGCLLQGHRTYESWVLGHHHHYQASGPSNGRYQKHQDILEANAWTAMGHEVLLHQPSETQMHEGTSVLLPLAQQSGVEALLLLEDEISSLVICAGHGGKTNFGLQKEA